jgi:hypothetical protein
MDFSSGVVLPGVETPEVVIQQPNEVVIPQQQPVIKAEPRAKEK